MKMLVAIALSALVGMIVGVLCCEETIRRLRRRVRELRAAKSSENPALANLSAHGKALYYQMVDSLERGESPKPALLEKKNILRSVTRFLFVTTQIFALFWVSLSYGIAAYSTVVLQQPFPVEELSRQAIITLLGMSGLKVVENIFEHNNGPVFGQSENESESEENHEAVYRYETDQG